jgi:hypothetical protein
MALLLWLAIPALGSLLVGIALLMALRPAQAVIVTQPRESAKLVSTERQDDLPHH